MAFPLVSIALIDMQLQSTACDSSHHALPCLNLCWGGGLGAVSMKPLLCAPEGPAVLLSISCESIVA